MLYMNILSAFFFMEGEYICVCVFVYMGVYILEYLTIYELYMYSIEKILKTRAVN